MPAGITLEEFLAWAALQEDEVKELSDDDLGLALQVGDKLSASDMERLTQELACRLKGRVVRTNGSRSLLSAFLPLSCNLQQLVFNSVGEVAGAKLLSWPRELQQAYADLWVASKSKAFTIPEDSSHAQALLSLLSRTDPALPRLGSLTVHCPIAIAAALCDALTHHSSITNLHIARLSWQPRLHGTAAARVFRTLPQLTALTALSLSCCAALRPSDQTAPSIDAASECVHALAAAISALPTLASVHLYNQQHSTHSNDGATAAAKRRKIAGCFGPPSMHAAQLSLDPVIAALSTAPALTSLAFTHITAGPTDQLPCSGIRGPFARLHELLLTFQRGSNSGTVLCTLCPTSSLLQIAPLPALQRVHLITYIPYDKACEATIAEALLKSASCQPALSDARLKFKGSQRTPRSHWVDAIDVRCQGQDDSTVVYLRVNRPVSAGSMRAIAAGVSHMRSLHNVCMEVNTNGERSFQHATTADISAMLRTLSHLTRLQSLSAFGREDADSETLSRSIVSGPLTSLVQLTELYLSFQDTGIAGVLLGQALRGLPNVQDLWLEGVLFPHSAQVKECLAPLTTLTLLELSMQPVDRAAVQAFADSAACMLRLQQARLKFWCPCKGSDSDPVPGPARDWMQGLVSLPPWGHFELEVDNRDVPDSVSVPIIAELEARGAEVMFCDDEVQVSFTSSKISDGSGQAELQGVSG